jgi:uncharacterized protein (DUF4415 family)
MNTIKEQEFDYQAYIKQYPPDSTKIQRGNEARRRRFEAAAIKRAVRIDEDILEQFRQLTPEGQECERFINQALREWLSATSVKELVREELHYLLAQALASVQVAPHRPKPTPNAL